MYRRTKWLWTFNVAASIKMRKSKRKARNTISRTLLQCGRIYKDAEIWILWIARICWHIHLQCGRIYKDAEMSCKGLAYGGELVHLQCGRIYKDAEISITYPANDAT